MVVEVIVRITYDTTLMGTLNSFNCELNLKLMDGVSHISNRCPLPQRMLLPQRPPWRT